MNEKALKIISYVLTAAGIGISLVSGIISEKQMDNKIAGKVNEAVAKLEQAKKLE